MLEFNPKEYKTFADLPEEEKPKFQELEGGGFVRKGVEENQEVAYQMGMIEDQAINTLRHELEASGLSMQEVLTRYEEAAQKYDYKNSRVYAEILRKFADLQFLTTGEEHDESLKKLFKKHYEQLGYSEKTQTLYLKNVDLENIEVVSRLLLDQRFTKDGDLIKRIKNEASIQDIFDIVKDKNIRVARMLIEKSGEKDFKLKALKEVIELVGRMDASTKRGAEYDVNLIQIQAAKYLIMSGNQADCFNLIDGG